MSLHETDDKKMTQIAKSPILLNILFITYQFFN